MRFNINRRPRKSNRSSPSHPKSSKKAKQPVKTDSQAESDHWSDVKTVNSEAVSSETDADEQLNICDNHTTTSLCDNTAINSITSITDTSISETIAISSASILAVIQPSIDSMSTITHQNDLIVNPVSGVSSPLMASAGDQTGTVIQEPFTQPPPTWVGYGGGYPQQSQQHLSNMPSKPMPAPMTSSCPSISDMDCMRIAVVVKNLLKTEISQLVKLEVQQATNHLTTEIVSLQKSNDDLTTQVRDLTGKVDDLEQYGRRMCIRISGVSEMQNENVNDIVMKLGGDISANVTRFDIDRAHRVGRKDDPGTTDDMDDDIADKPVNTAAKTVTKSRDIIVKFTNSSARLAFLKGRKVLREKKSKIFINEDLTASRTKLAFQCRDLKRDRKSSVSKTWVFNGNVFVQDKAGAKHKTLTLSDLKSFTADSGQAIPAGQGPGTSV